MLVSSRTSKTEVGMPSESQEHFLVVHVLALSRYWCCSYTLYFCLLELEVYVLVLFCSRAYISLFKVNY